MENVSLYFRSVFFLGLRHSRSTLSTPSTNAFSSWKYRAASWPASQSPSHVASDVSIRIQSPCRLQLSPAPPSILVAFKKRPCFGHLHQIYHGAADHLPCPFLFCFSKCSDASFWVLLAKAWNLCSTHWCSLIRPARYKDTKTSRKRYTSSKKTSLHYDCIKNLLVCDHENLNTVFTRPPFAVPRSLNYFIRLRPALGPIITSHSLLNYWKDSNEHKPKRV